MAFDSATASKQQAPTAPPQYNPTSQTHAYVEIESTEPVELLWGFAVFSDGTLKGPGTMLTTGSWVILGGFLDGYHTEYHPILLEVDPDGDDKVTAKCPGAGVCAHGKHYACCGCLTNKDGDRVPFAVCRCPPKPHQDGEPLIWLPECNDTSGPDYQECTAPDPEDCEEDEL